MHVAADASFFKTDFICSSCMLPSFILGRVCFAKFAISAAQITKGKLEFRKIENMQLWHLVSSVTKKKTKNKKKNEISWTEIILAVSSQTFQRHALKFQYRQATGNGYFC